MNAAVFQQIQRQFLAHLRQPSPDNQPEGFAGDRLAVYAELLYNKFDESLTACFPVLNSILEPVEWRTLLQDFIAKHRCLSPYYRQIPDEFVLYLQNERQTGDDPPFLAELAHFEWMELVLSVTEAEPVETAMRSGAQLLDSVPVFAPVTRLLHYVWPVQQINRTYQPDEPPVSATHILGFRNAEDQVRFIALSEATAGLILRLQNQCTARQALLDMGTGLTLADQSNLMLFGKEILTDLYRQGAIIGIYTH